MSPSPHAMRRTSTAPHSYLGVAPRNFTDLTCPSHSHRYSLMVKIEAKTAIPHQALGINLVIAILVLAAGALHAPPKPVPMRSDTRAATT